LKIAHFGGRYDSYIVWGYGGYIGDLIGNTDWKCTHGTKMILLFGIIKNTLLQIEYYLEVISNPLVELHKYSVM
jgi:hypothetical protein